MKLELTDDEAGALAKHIRRTLDNGPFSLSPRLDPLKAILPKPDPPAPRPEPLPKMHAPSRDVSGRKRRAGPVAMKTGVTGDADR
jgi:hypothetical protein